VCIGLISDFTKNKYGMPRSYCLVLVAVVFFVSQVAAGTVNDIAHLWIASSILGIAYGSVFSLFPTVCLEWFGMRKC
jgi:MFS family permease